jgi:hypothetical protein
MKTVLSTIVVLFGGVLVTSSWGAGASPRSADEAWQAVKAEQNASAARLNAPRTALLVRAESSATAMAARQLAQSAREFRLQFPDHGNAEDARKIETLAALRGVWAEDSAYEAAALATAQTYRADGRQPLADRIEVAFLAERTAIRNKFGGSVYVNNGPELLAIAERLHREFGDAPAIFNLYLQIARTADMNTGVAAANRVLATPVSRDAQVDARRVVDRFALLGRSLEIPLRLGDGTSVAWPPPGSKPTLLFYWDSSGPRMNPRVMAALPRDARIFHAVRGATGTQLDSLRRTNKVPGTLCLDASAPGTAGGPLWVQHLPYVFAFDRTGKLTGYGPLVVAESVFAGIPR